ncbi:MAG TPA: methyltransferase domain-containing protein [Pyrinomonadaceae bacterium]|nr:methyltransferase domain-containing protein [Pyrinomonadaceae bacterium]
MSRTEACESERGRPGGESPVYDRIARHYDRAMRPLERLFLARLRRETLRQLPTHARLLEVGAGTGANFSLYPAGASGAATEPSGEMLSRARARPERPREVSLVRATAERLPFADGAFDAAFATLVFCSVAEPRRALTELRRVVRRGGRVVLLEHVRPEGALGHVFDALSVLTVALIEDHFNRRTEDEARRAGLRVLSAERRCAGVFQIIVCEV